MATRGLIKGVWGALAILGLCVDTVRAGQVVELQRWADEGVLIRGKGMGEDLVLLVAEVRWDPTAPKTPSSYQIRVAFPDGRVDSRPYPVDYPPGRSRLVVYVAAGAVRDLVPSAVRVAVTVIEAGSGSPVSNTLTAGIEQFPRPRGDASANDPGPFGWGQALEGASGVLPNLGPDGLRFARIAGSGGLHVATTEATVGQVGRRLPGYDAKAGRSDEFALEDPAQPAINLTPAKALEYLKGLSQAEPSGITFRLPTVDEWTRAAQGGKATPFWWGDAASFGEGANLLGPEPALAGDSTASSQPSETSPTFQSNPFGLAHTFGNAAEWAVVPSGGFARMGGHFRTEPVSPLPSVTLEKADELGPDAFVGVRPVFDLTPEAAANLIRKRLTADPKLAGVTVAFDPERSVARLTGSVLDSPTRRAADRILEGFWFVARVDNQLQTPTLIENQLSTLSPVAGPVRRVAILDRTFVEFSMPVRWLDPLPVSGTSWWVNVFLQNGARLDYKIDPSEPGRSSKVLIRIDREKLAALGVPDTAPVRVALSVGAPASSDADARVVSNTVEVRPTFPASSR